MDCRGCDGTGETLGSASPGRRCAYCGGSGRAPGRQEESGPLLRWEEAVEGNCLRARDGAGRQVAFVVWMSSEKLWVLTVRINDKPQQIDLPTSLTTAKERRVWAQAVLTAAIGARWA